MGLILHSSDFALLFETDNTSGQSGCKTASDLVAFYTSVNHYSRCQRVENQVQYKQTVVLNLHDHDKHIYHHDKYGTAMYSQLQYCRCREGVDCNSTVQALGICLIHSAFFIIA